MPRQPFSPVSAGDPVVIHSAEMNAWNAVARGEEPFAGGGGATFGREAVYCRLHNSTGDDLERGQILAITGPWGWDAEDDEAEQEKRFPRLPQLTGDAATRGTSLETWQWSTTPVRIAVLDEPIPADGVGRAIIGGIAAVRVRQVESDPESTLGDVLVVAPPPSSATADKYTLRYAGQLYSGLPVLWMGDTAASETWAYVRLETVTPLAMIPATLAADWDASEGTDCTITFAGSTTEYDATMWAVAGSNLKIPGGRECLVTATPSGLSVVVVQGQEVAPVCDLQDAPSADALQLKTRYLASPVVTDLSEWGDWAETTDQCP